MGRGVKAVYVVGNPLRECLDKIIILQREAENLLQTSGQILTDGTRWI
jgi:hypothetical protein